MTRSDISAAVLTVAAAGAVALGVVRYPTMAFRFKPGMPLDYECASVQAHATILLALALFTAACLCTAAVLWDRGGRGKVP